MSNQVFMCPRCGTENECCDFVSEVKRYETEWGDYSPNDGHNYRDSECNDSETISTEYKCPTCEATLPSDPDECFYFVGSPEYLQEKQRLIEEGIIAQDEVPAVSNE